MTYIKDIYFICFCNLYYKSINIYIYIIAFELSMIMIVRVFRKRLPVNCFTGFE